MYAHMCICTCTSIILFNTMIIRTAESCGCLLRGSHPRQAEGLKTSPDFPQPGVIIYVGV